MFNISKMIAASAVLAFGMSVPALADASNHHRHTVRHGHHTTHVALGSHHRHVARAGFDNRQIAEAPPPVAVAPVAPAGVVGDGVGLGLGLADTGVGIGADAIRTGFNLADIGLGIGTGAVDAGVGIVDPYHSPYRRYPADRDILFGDDLF